MARKQYSAEEKAEYREKKKKELEAAYEKINEGVQKIFSSEEYLEYLRFSSRFTNYSPNNKMLIHMQAPEATRVAAYGKWSELGRQVKKGEHGIKIFAPVIKNKESEVLKDKTDKYGNVLYNADGTKQQEKVQVKDENQKVLCGYKLVTVFDVSQTYGDPLPEMVKPMALDKDFSDKEKLEAICKGIEKVCGIKPEFKEIDKDTDGYFDRNTNEIVIRSGMSDYQTLCAIVHESAHSMLHKKGGEFEDADKRRKEIQAESAAFVICSQLGVDTELNSLPYIAGWAQGKTPEELKVFLKETETVTALMSRSIGNELDALERRRAAAREEEQVVSGADKFYISSENTITWIYFNPQGNSEKGQLVTSIIDEYSIKDAYSLYAENLKKDSSKAAEIFFEILYSECKTYLDDNDGSDKYKRLIESFNNDPADLVIEDITADHEFSAEALISFYRKSNTYFNSYVINTELSQCRTVPLNTAVKMWENGFEILDNNANAAVSYNQSGDDGYAQFENADCNAFYVSTNDFRIQNYFDECAAACEKLEMLGYPLEEYCGTALSEFNESLGVYENIQSALARGEDDIVYAFAENVEYVSRDDNDEIIAECISQIKEALSDVNSSKAQENTKSYKKQKNR